MATYRVVFPFVDDMGSVPTIIATTTYRETAQENALWHINRMRDHDGLPHLTQLPNGTKFERIEENLP